MHLSGAARSGLDQLGLLDTHAEGKRGPAESRRTQDRTAFHLSNLEMDDHGKNAHHATSFPRRDYD